MSDVATPWSVSFSDGSGNAFIFRSKDGGAEFHYLPVDVAHSSSGTYSGGTQRTGDLDDDAQRELWLLVARGESATSEHSVHRAKGTGAFHVETPAGAREFVLKRGPSLKAFEAFADAFRGAPAGSKQVFIGVAQNAKVGAVLVTDGGDVWVDLPEWPDALTGKKLRVRGRFATHNDLPVFVARPGEPQRAGIPMPEGTDLDAASARRVLEDLEWEVVE